MKNILENNFEKISDLLKFPAISPTKYSSAYQFEKFGKPDLKDHWLLSGEDLDNEHNNYKINLIDTPKRQAHAYLSRGKLEHSSLFEDHPLWKLGLKNFTKEINQSPFQTIYQVLGLIKENEEFIFKHMLNYSKHIIIPFKKHNKDSALAITSKSYGNACLDTTSYKEIGKQDTFEKWFGQFENSLVILPD